MERRQYTPLTKNEAWRVRLVLPCTHRLDMFRLPLEVYPLQDTSAQPVAASDVSVTSLESSDTSRPQTPPPAPAPSHPRPSLVPELPLKTLPAFEAPPAKVLDIDQPVPLAVAVAPSALAPPPIAKHHASVAAIVAPTNPSAPKSCWACCARGGGNAAAKSAAAAAERSNATKDYDAVEHLPKLAELAVAFPASHLVCDNIAVSKGLTSADAAAKLAEFGPNCLTPPKDIPVGSEGASYG